MPFDCSSSCSLLFFYFYYIKVGCKGVCITRTCFHDVNSATVHVIDTKRPVEVHR